VHRGLALARPGNERVMIKKLRRMLFIQAALWALAARFAWKNKEAIERSARAARAAWYEGTRPEPADEVLFEEVTVATVFTPEEMPGTGAPAMPTSS
jgi:hypothetical protein